MKKAWKNSPTQHILLAEICVPPLLPLLYASQATISVKKAIIGTANLLKVSIGDSVDIWSCYFVEMAIWCVLWVS